MPSSKPKLSRLTVLVDDAAAGLAGIVVKLDGRELGRGEWGVALPHDAGEHVVEAQAPGYKLARKSVTLGPQADVKEVSIPKLEVDPTASPALASPGEKPAPGPGQDQPRTPPSGSGLKTWGFVAGAAGVVALGVGGFFTYRAVQKKDESSNDCDGNVCGENGTAARNDARAAGNAATVAFIASGVLLATGAVFFAVEAGPRQAGARLRVTF